MNQPLPSEVVEAYVFANTPAYLYRKLRNNDYVMRLSQWTDEDLSKIIQAASREDIESVPLAYAALFALLRKNSFCTIENTLSTTHGLEWANALVSIYKQRTIPTSHNQFKVPSVKSIGSENCFAPTQTTVTSIKVSQNV